MLQAYYNQINNSYTADFPDNPPNPFNYTATYTGGFLSMMGTRVKVLDYNSTVQIVFQDTSLLFFESHPIHLHGFNFFVVGQGSGNYNNKKDPALFNLVDPQERNTINVPKGGWVALRFRADNPGESNTIQ